MDCMYIPETVVRHRSSTTSGKVSLQKLYWIERNRIWVLLKYYPVEWILVSPWYTMRRLALAWLSARKGRGLAGEVGREHSSFRLLSTFLRAWADAAKAGPKMLQKRKHLMTLRKGSMSHWRRLMRKYLVTVADMSFSEMEEGAN